MKKFLAIFLALLMVMTVALVSCKKDDKTDEGDDWDNEDYDNIGSGSESGSGSETESGTETGDGTTPAGSWTEVNQTVYVLHPVYLRTAMIDTAKSTIALDIGETLTRVGVHSSERWAKVTYNGETYFVYNFVLSTSPVNFAKVENVETTVINSRTDGTEDTYYLRSTPCLASTTKYNDVLNNSPVSVKKSETTENKLVITGYDAANNCARVTYKGNSYYIVATFLEYYKTGNNAGGGSILPA